MFGSEAATRAGLIAGVLVGMLVAANPEHQKGIAKATSPSPKRAQMPVAAGSAPKVKCLQLAHKCRVPVTSAARYSASGALSRAARIAASRGPP